MRLTNSLPELHSHRRNRPPESDISQLHHLQTSHFHPPSFSSDDFLDQILSSIPPPWELPAGFSNPHSDLPPQPPPPPNPDNVAFQTGDNTPAAKMAMAMLHQQLLAAAAADSGLLQLPGNDVVEVEGSSSFKSPNPIIGDGSVIPSHFNEFAGFLNASVSGHNHNQNQSQGNSNSNSQRQSFGAPVSLNTPPAAGTSSGGGGGAAAPSQPRQRVRARRGQATDPHSIAERLRRERIAERMKALQELVPNANKTDKASMLDEIIDYVKFLQLQVKVLSMSRLGGATAAMSSHLLPDISSQGGTDCNQTNGTDGAGGQTSAGAKSSNDVMTVTEHQVVKLMEEDMGSAMQYLQGKGLCLMPISLATAISTATCHSRPIAASKGAGECPTSPSLSALTVQSTAVGNGTVKDSASISQP